MKKKDIVITSLAMRFYESKGWELKTLLPYLISGNFVRKSGFSSDYYILEPQSKFNIEKLYKDGHVGELEGRSTYSELDKLSDLEVLKDRSW